MNTQPFDINTPRSADGFWHCKTRDGRDARVTLIPTSRFAGVIEFSARIWNYDGTVFANKPGIDDLDLSTVETLPKDEYAELKAAHAAGKVIQANIMINPVWRDTDPKWNLPPDCYRIKPEPVRVPLSAADVPPGSVFRLNISETGFDAYASIENFGVVLANRLGERFAWSKLQQDWLINRPRHRDADGNPTLWEPCYKTQEAE